jgi:glucosamine--fructose-6-phosphate aminotransferase (isomerizing)
VDHEIKGHRRRVPSPHTISCTWRGPNFPVALEGALKLKEIPTCTPRLSGGGDEARSDRAHRREHAGGRHLPARDGGYRRSSGTSRSEGAQGPHHRVATEGDRDIIKKADHVITIPETLNLLTPILSVIPLQLLAYHIAVLRGCGRRPAAQPRDSR